LVHKVQ
jgi:hypothetical protein